MSNITVELLEHLERKQTPGELKITDSEGVERIFQYGMLSEVRPLKKISLGCTLGSIESLCSFLKEYGTKENTTVLIRPKGIVATLNVEALAEDNQAVHVGFFAADLPPSSWMSQDDFTLYLDRNEGKFSGVIRKFEPDGVVSTPLDENSIRMSLKSITASESKDTTVEDEGTHSNVSMKASSRLVVTQEMPSVMIFKLRRGTREFETEHRFRFRIEKRDGAIQYKLDHLNRDGAEEAFMSFAKFRVENNLEGWKVYEAE